MTHKEVVDIAHKWALKNCSCGVVFKELNCGSEYADVIAFGQSRSVLIEVKVSRSDFFADFKKPFRKYPERGMGKYRYYCCPEGLIKQHELPTGWGLIYVNRNKAICVHKPVIEHTNERGNKYRAMYSFEYNQEAERAVMYSALRRLQIRGYIDSIYDCNTINQPEIIEPVKQPTLF